MTSSAFPDVNVWLALTIPDHAHNERALSWWRSTTAQQIVFCRVTQISLLRILTTPAVMNGKPLSMRGAWKSYERLALEARVVWLSEPPNLDSTFQRLSNLERASPKLWNDFYIAAFAECAGATLVTFDRALANRCKDSLLLS